MARGSTSNGILKCNYVTEGFLTSSVTPNGIVYIGSGDHNVYALNADTGRRYGGTPREALCSPPPTVSDGIAYIGTLIIINRVSYCEILTNKTLYDLNLYLRDVGVLHIIFDTTHDSKLRV